MWLCKHSTANWSWNVNPTKQQTQTLLCKEDSWTEGRAKSCSRERSKVMKINSPLVWTRLCCSLCGTSAHFLRVSSANASLLLYFSSCFISMPQRDCDLHYVWGATISHSCSLLSDRFQSASFFDLLLPVVLGMAELHHTVCVATVWNSSSSGAWERWPQGLAVGVQNSLESGDEIKGSSGWKTKWLSFLSLAGCGQVGGLWESQDDGCDGDPSDFWPLREWWVGRGQHLSNCSTILRLVKIAHKTSCVSDSSVHTHNDKWERYTTAKSLLGDCVVEWVSGLIRPRSARGHWDRGQGRGNPLHPSHIFLHFLSQQLHIPHSLEKWQFLISVFSFDGEFVWRNIFEEQVVVDTNTKKKCNKSTSLNFIVQWCWKIDTSLSSCILRFFHY